MLKQHVIEPGYEILVLHVAGKELNVADDVLKLGHLVHLGLLKGREAIEDVGIAALKEEAVEVKLSGIAFEWGELTLNFQDYKSRGPLVLKARISHSFPWQGNVLYQGVYAHLSLSSCLFFQRAL